MRRLPTLRRGVVRLLTQGSVASQVKRPFAFVFHVMRRSPPSILALGEAQREVQSSLRSFRFRIAAYEKEGAKTQNR